MDGMSSWYSPFSDHSVHSVMDAVVSGNQWSFSTPRRQFFGPLYRAFLFYHSRDTRGYLGVFRGQRNWPVHLYPKATFLRPFRVKRPEITRAMHASRSSISAAFIPKYSFRWNFHPCRSMTTVFSRWSLLWQVWSSWQSWVVLSFR